MTTPKRSLKNRLMDWIGPNPLRWHDSVQNVLSLVKQAETHKAGDPSRGTPPQTIAIIVTVWLTTWVPWYSVIIGLLLKTRGNRVVFIHDDLSFGDTPRISAMVRHFIRRVMRSLAKRYTVINLSDFAGGSAPLATDTVRQIERLAVLNAVHKLRGETQLKGRAAYESRVRSQLQLARPAIDRLLANNTFDVIVTPGGVYGSSALWIAAGEAHNVRVSTFDAGTGLLLLAARGVAAQLQDIPAAFAHIKQDAASPSKEAIMLKLARSEIDKRQSCNSSFNYQIAVETVSPLKPYEGAILIALNSSWDQAALGLHTVFKDSADWIVESVRWILENTEAKVVVRQHPAERFDLARTSDDYGSLLHSAFGAHERLFFIAAVNPVNSYDLLAVSSAVLTYTSTFGVEATALGKPTITASRSYYADLGFVWSARTCGDYYALLAQAAARELTVSADMQRDALLCYYTTQVCNWNYTHFNPVNDEFFQRSLADLRTAQDVDVILTVLETGTPSAVLNHKQQLLKHQALRS